MFLSNNRQSANIPQGDTTELRKATIIATLMFFAIVGTTWLWGLLRKGENMFGYSFGWRHIIEGYSGVYVALREKKLWKSLLKGALITVVISLVFSLIFDLPIILKNSGYNFISAALYIVKRMLPSYFKWGLVSSWLGFFARYISRPEFKIIETVETEEDESSD